MGESYRLIKIDVMYIREESAWNACGRFLKNDGTARRRVAEGDITGR